MYSCCSMQMPFYLIRQNTSLNLKFRYPGTKTDAVFRLRLADESHVQDINLVIQKKVEVMVRDLEKKLGYTDDSIVQWCWRMISRYTFKVVRVINHSDRCLKRGPSDCKDLKCRKFCGHCDQTCKCYENSGANYYLNPVPICNVECFASVCATVDEISLDGQYFRDYVDVYEPGVVYRPIYMVEMFKFLVMLRFVDCKVGVEDKNGYYLVSIVRK